MIGLKSRFARCPLGKLALLVGTVLTLAACGASSSGSTTNGTDGNNGNSNGSGAVQDLEHIQVSLKSLNETDPCADLRGYLIDYAEQTVSKQLTATREWAGKGSSLVGADTVAQANGTMAAPATGLSASATGVSASATTGAVQFTTTNLQTIGIDEPDSIKNDGRYIYQLHRAAAPASGITGPFAATTESVLSKSRYWPADQMAVLGQTSLPVFKSAGAGNESYYAATTHGMFLTENAQAVVLRSVDNNVYPLAVDAVASANAAVAMPVSSAAQSAALCPLQGCQVFNTPSSTRLDVLDVAGDAAPVALASIEVAGRLLDARRKGNSVWLVTNQPFLYPSFVK